MRKGLHIVSATAPGLPVVSLLLSLKSRLEKNVQKVDWVAVVSHQPN